MMRDPYDPYGGQQSAIDEPVTAQDLDDRTPEQQRADAIVGCELCDEHGYRAGSIVCLHFDFAPAAARGKAACLEALKKERGRLMDNTIANPDLTAGPGLCWQSNGCCRCVQRDGHEAIAHLCLHGIAMPCSGPITATDVITHAISQDTAVIWPRIGETVMAALSAAGYDVVKRAEPPDPQHPTEWGGGAGSARRWDVWLSKLGAVEVRVPMSVDPETAVALAGGLMAARAASAEQVS